MASPLPAAVLAALALQVPPPEPHPEGWDELPPLPVPAANNAVAAAETSRGWAVFSFLGIDTTRAWDGVSNRAFRLNLGDPAWTELPPVPGPGRLAPTAESLNGLVYVFGGYTVAEDGSEKSLPNVDVFDPETGEWSRGADMPVPVDDAVSGVWRDSLIYLVSGWHDTGNVARVQVYDPGWDEWQDATPIPGVPVFGHAGAIAGDAIVYLGGARVTGGTPRYAIEPSAWRGDIDPDDPLHITWRRLAAPPGPPLYRAAAGAMDGMVAFAGGTANPYNYDGIGYDGVASEPVPGVFAYRVSDDTWTPLAPLVPPTMDHRNLAVVNGRLVLAGGMESGQRVTARARISRPLVPLPAHGGAN